MVRTVYRHVHPTHRIRGAPAARTQARARVPTHRTPPGYRRSGTPGTTAAAPLR